jgi:hypothetical protein
MNSALEFRYTYRQFSDFFACNVWTIFEQRLWEKNFHETKCRAKSKPEDGQRRGVLGHPLRPPQRPVVVPERVRRQHDWELGANVAIFFFASFNYLIIQKVFFLFFVKTTTLAGFALTTHNYAGEKLSLDHAARCERYNLKSWRRF